MYAKRFPARERDEGVMPLTWSADMESNQSPPRRGRKLVGARRCQNGTSSKTRSKEPCAQLESVGNGTLDSPLRSAG